MKKGKSKLELARNEALLAWRRLSPVVDQPLDLQFKPLASALMIVEIVEGRDVPDVSAVPLNPLRDERIAQFEESWTETSTGLKVAVGVVLVGVRYSRTNQIAGEVRLLPPAVGLVAKIFSRGLDDMTDSLSASGAAIVSQIISSLAVVPRGAVDFIKET